MSKPRRKSSFTSLNVKFSDFEERKQIGSGKDCAIYKARWKGIGRDRVVVVKAYNRSAISSTKVRSIKREARMMQTVKDHGVPHVVDYYGSFRDTSHMYIVMEFCGKGDLLETILREGQAMSERRVVKEVALPLLISLTAMHKISLIHRDIKLENVFVDENGGVKFGDFGLTMSTEEERGISPVGTVEYMAPELCKLPPAEFIISGKIDLEDVAPINEKVDIWALGVTLFELVTGRSPFEGGSKSILKQNIVRYNIRRIPRHLSKECEDFLLKMLTYNATNRPSARSLLDHCWIQGNTTPPLRVFAMDTTSSISEHSMRPESDIPSTKRVRNVSQDVNGGRGGDGYRNERHVSDNSPAPPLVSPTSILLVTERRKEKFQDKLAKLLPIYRSPHEQDICMRGLWELSLSDESEDENL